MVFEAPDLNVEWYTAFIAVIQNAIWCHHVICDEKKKKELLPRCLLLRRKATTNLDSVLKSRDIILPTKVCLVNVMFFSCHRVWIWIIKKAECQRVDAFELWCWRRLLRVLWTARNSNQFILREISPEYSLKGLMLKQELQNFGYLM